MPVLAVAAVVVGAMAQAASGIGFALVCGPVLIATLGQDEGVRVAVLLSLAAWRLLRQTAAVLLESTPPGVEPAAVAATIAAVPGVESVHDLHVWSLSATVHALSAHVVVSGHPSLEEAQLVGRSVKVAVSAPYRIAHATIELECEGCVDDGSWCAISPAVMSRDQARSVHPSHVGHAH